MGGGRLAGTIGGDPILYLLMVPCWYLAIMTIVDNMIGKK